MDGRCVILMLTIALTVLPVCAAQVQPMPVGAGILSGSGGTLLVLVDGRVLNGRLTPRPDGYDVQVAAGRMYISSDRVRFIASDLKDAYLRMRSSQSELTPEVHVELARWCLANKLPEEAHRELLDALHLDPYRTDAKRMLATLVDGSGSLGNPSVGSGLTEYPSTRKSSNAPIESRSLAGLSRSVAQEFTRHVQPLMMNKCANGGCHGSGSESSFQLASAHRGSSPMIAERNLAAVLKQIDLTRPSTSPLLVEVEGTHGNLNVPLFRGRIGAQQLEMFRNWVKAAANDIAPDASVEDRVDESGIQLASAIKVSVDPGTLPHIHNDNTVTPHGRRLSTADTDAKFLAEAVRENANDEFDPSVFNMKFHGRTTLGENADASELQNEPSGNDSVQGIRQ